MLKYVLQCVTMPYAMLKREPFVHDSKFKHKGKARISDA